MTKQEEHFKQMQEMCCDYLQPDGGERYGAAICEEDRRNAFISDIIYMLDGPEQREAFPN